MGFKSGTGNIPTQTITGDLTVGDDLTLNSDAAIVTLGASGNEVTLTHFTSPHGDGVILGGSSALAFRTGEDAIIKSPTAGQLDIKCFGAGASAINIACNASGGGGIVLTGNSSATGSISMRWDATPGRVDFTTENAGDGVIHQLVDGKDLVIKQYDGYEVARAMDNGGWTSRKRIKVLESGADLNFASLGVAASIPYSGAVVAMDQNGGSSTITLPTATTTAEGTKLAGWYIEVFNYYAGAYDCTIVRGDSGADTLVGAVADAAQSTGVTISSHEVTFVDAASRAGDYVRVVCYGASASSTSWVAYAVSNA